MAGVIALCAGFLVDLGLGDPRWLYHPVCAIGKWIAFWEKKLRRWFPKTGAGERAAGIALVLLVLLACGAIPMAVLLLLYQWNFWAGLAVETFWCYQMLATKSLKTESMKVYEALSTGTLEDGRYAVSMIVGRDTEALSEEGLLRRLWKLWRRIPRTAVIAPLCFILLGGSVAGFAYKGVNTMDSMLGYKNEKYLNFGRCGGTPGRRGQLIPARMAAWLMVAASVWRSGRQEHSGFVEGSVQPRESEFRADGVGDAPARWACAGGRCGLFWENCMRNPLLGSRSPVEGRISQIQSAFVCHRRDRIWMAGLLLGGDLRGWGL